MIEIRSSADMARAIDDADDPQLKRLLSLRFVQLTTATTADLGELAHVLIAEAGDDLAEIEAAAGLPLSGDEAFVEWVQRHPGGWIEATAITDDDGFAVVVLVPDRPSTNPHVLQALLAHA